MLKNRLYRIFILGFLSLSLAFVHPQANDLIELTEGLNLRKSAHFRDGVDDSNKVTVAPENSKGLIKKVKKFASGNYGICVEFIKTRNLNPLGNDDCYWVYYHKTKPSMKLFQVAQDEIRRQEMIRQWTENSRTSQQFVIVVEPERAQAVQTIREVSGIDDRFVRS